MSYFLSFFLTYTIIVNSQHNMKWAFSFTEFQMRNVEKPGSNHFLQSIRAFTLVKSSENNKD